MKWPAMLLALLVGAAAPASAQSSSDTGVIQIAVKDAAAQHALPDARVFLLGPTVASALTNATGIVRYTDVPSGIYRVRVSKSSYAAVTSSAFEVLDGKEVEVDVDLGLRPQLKVIGHVTSRVAISTTDVDANSPVRRISDSLTDALGTIAGVDVTQDSNDPNAPQTVSLHGQDETQTAVTLDGIPLSAPGAAADLRKINTDLFTGAGVGFGPSAGALAGTLNFRTLQPTQTWQTAFASSYGTFDKYNYQLGETGSIGKLGIAVLHTKRAGNNQLTFQDYLDQSGLAYPHGGESSNAGDFLKVRYGLSDTTTLLVTTLQNHQASSALCTQFVTPRPCGIGPGNGSAGAFSFAYATIQSLIGQTALSVTGYVNNDASFTNDLARLIAPAGGGTPVLSPYASQNDTLARGLAASATMTRDKHTITLSGSTYAGITTFTPLAGGSAFVRAATSATASRSLEIADQYKVNDRLTLGPRVSYAGTTGAGSSLLAGFGVAWRPSNADSYHASVAVGSAQPANGLVRSYSDPLAARVNCFAGTALVNGPGDQPQHQSAVSSDASWTHAWTHGQVTLDAYRQTQAGQLVGADVTAASLGLPGTSYFNDIASYFGTVCGAGAVPPAVYVQERIGDTTRLYQGYTASARIGIGPDVVVIPSYATQVAAVTAADPLYTGLDSTLIVGEQLPGRPLHTANLTVDAFHPPSGIEVLANAHYVGANNNQSIAPYVTVNAGLSRALGMGRLTVFAGNLFGTESAAFSTLQYAQPIPLAGGSALLTAARPNAPRQYTVTYTFNTGARRNALLASAPAAAPPHGGFGFGRLSFTAPPAGTDPLAVATSRPECTADLQPLAKMVLAQLGAAAGAYAAGNALPTVNGLTVTPFGARTGTWWFGLSPNIPESLRPPRRPDVPAAPRGYQERVAVGPEAATEPQPAFSPSPQLLAALAPFRALASCSYGTVLTPADAKARGYDVSTAAGRGRGRGLRYAPQLGIFVVRAPQLGTGGGSVKP